MGEAIVVPASIPEPDPRDVADLLQLTFTTQTERPLDPSMIQLMLELSHAPDAAPQHDKAPPPDVGRKPLFRFLFAGRFRRARGAG